MKYICRWLKVVSAAGVFLWLLLPTPLLACAACTGRSDSSLAEGMNWGIVTLLGFVLTVLSCFVVFFVHVARRTPPEDGDPGASGPSLDSRL